MSDEEEKRHDEDLLADDEQQVGLADSFIADIRELLDQDYIEQIHEQCRDLPAPDMAELLSKVNADDRHKLLEVLEDQLDPETYSYLDSDTLNEIVHSMPAPQVAAIVNALDSDDALNLINDIDEEHKEEIIKSLSRKVRAAVEEGLTFPEYSAGRLMQREFVAIPQFWTIGKTIDYLRAAADSLPAKFHDIFVVDPMHRLVGTATLSRLLCTQRAVKIDAILEEDSVSIPVTMDQEQTAFLFKRRDLLSAPVVDDDERLIGVITVDDIVDVIEEEAEDDILKLGGVSDSDIFRPTIPTARARFLWLVVNLFTAFADTYVISLFEGTIEKIVALAALMPVVASMGGNAGTQTLTVAVRGLATKELTSANAARLVAKEFVVGCINGLLFALIMIGIVVFWYGNWKLGLVMGAAIVFNLIAAGLSGVLIPLVLNRVGADPAHSGAVFLTTVTDVFGFFAFLGLATLFLL